MSLLSSEDRLTVHVSMPTLSEKNFRRSIWDTVYTKPLVGWFAAYVLEYDIVRHHKVRKHRLELCCRKPPSRAMKQLQLSISTA